MRFIGGLLRVYSYIFEAILCLMALAFALVIYMNPGNTLNLGWLPWTGESLAPWLAAAGAVGLLGVLLAASRKFRLLHFLFAIAAFVILVRGLFLGGWSFHGEDEFRRALWLVIAALVAALGSLPFGGSPRDVRSSRP